MVPTSPSPSSPAPLPSPVRDGTVPPSPTGAVYDDAYSAIIPDDVASTMVADAEGTLSSPVDLITHNTRPPTRGELDHVKYVRMCRRGSPVGCDSDINNSEDTGWLNSVRLCLRQLSRIGPRLVRQLFPLSPCLLLHLVSRLPPSVSSKGMDGLSQAQKRPGEGESWCSSRQRALLTRSHFRHMCRLPLRVSLARFALHQRYLFHDSS